MYWDLGPWKWNAARKIFISGFLYPTTNKPDPTQAHESDPDHGRCLSPTTFSNCGGGFNGYMTVAIWRSRWVKRRHTLALAAALWRSSPSPFCRLLRRRRLSYFQLLQPRLNPLRLAPFLCCRLCIVSADFPPWGWRAAAGGHSWLAWLPMKRRWPAVRLSIFPSWVFRTSFFVLFGEFRRTPCVVVSCAFVFRFWLWEKVN